MANSVVVQASGLTREFYRRGSYFNAVEEANLQVSSGQMVMIQGRSGNGKSTLLNMLAGLLQPTRGQVRICGQLLGDLDDSELSTLRGSRIGYATQQETLIASLNVRENILLPALIAKERGIEKPYDVNARAESLMKALQIEGLSEVYPRELSGGETRRVIIARTLINIPELVIADEPTGDLDEESTGLVMNLLRSATDDGAAVIVVTHDSDTSSFADQIYTITKGVLK